MSSSANLPRVHDRSPDSGIQYSACEGMFNKLMFIDNLIPKLIRFLFRSQGFRTTSDRSYHLRTAKNKKMAHCSFDQHRTHFHRCFSMVDGPSHFPDHFCTIVAQSSLLHTQLFRLFHLSLHGHSQTGRCSSNVRSLS